ncbi:hypothetical protein SAY87_028706 [Trapa incisa]|uniref:non-specific serine/threonine protein kinase n=1 Tax=Trapa incisa TaxID=236973 RepID=A0AAN7QPL4_9MYRT|nr:hypothetical protein SAY87_028706 [Trapa incisa]
METPPNPTYNPKLQQSQWNPTSDFRPPSSPYRKKRSFASKLKRAAKKASCVFAIFQRKRNPSLAPISELGRNNGRDTEVSYSIDASTESNTTSLSKLRSSFSVSSSSTAANGQVGPSNFSFEEILKATDNFSQANVIGEGGFGTVYKGKLKDGSLVAVKRARKNMNDHQSLSDFKNEVLTLSQIEHLNLVRLYGFLERGDERVMVVEYVSNGTLAEHLHGVHGEGLEIAERLDIAIDVAHAITYLHTYTDPPIIHRDIKSSNILINEKLRAKVADFGFARVAKEGSDATHISTQIKGSTGYLDPEYLRTYQLSEKSDVYSFGVLLVEMMTGRHPIESKRSVSERSTVKWAMQKLKDGDSVLAMDWRIRRNPASVKAHEEVLKLARKCLGNTRQSRPTMRKCVEVLWGIRKELKERASVPLPMAFHHSADFPTRDVKDSPHGTEEGERFKFVSA